MANRQMVELECRHKCAANRSRASKCKAQEGITGARSLSKGVCHVGEGNRWPSRVPGTFSRNQSRPTSPPLDD
jgi:hypothetical protein